jgi:hypothetical protein
MEPTEKKVRWLVPLSAVRPAHWAITSVPARNADMSRYIITLAATGTALIVRQFPRNFGLMHGNPK